MQNIIKFQDHTLEFVEINGDKYLNGAQIGQCLNLSQGSHAVGKIYKRNRKEFTPEMSIAAEMPTTTGNKLTRLYSLRGAALIAMYAQTPVAAQFRAFILDVLEGKQSTKAQAEQINAIRMEILRLKPEWQRIMYYSAVGLSAREIGKIMGRCKDTIRKERARIKACGFPIQIPSKGGQRKQLSLPFGG